MSLLSSSGAASVCSNTKADRRSLCNVEKRAITAQLHQVTRTYNSCSQNVVPDVLI